MSDKENKKSPLLKFTFFKKLKSIKHFDLVVALILGAIVVLIYFSSFNSTPTQRTSQSHSGAKISYTNASAYSKEIERKLSAIISKIDGVGKANVMVVLSSSSEIIIAKTITESHKTEKDENGVITENTTKEESPLLITQNGKSEPLILLEILPKITGVVVVAQGAKDVNTRLNILKAIQALISDISGNIEIIEGD